MSAVHRGNSEVVLHLPTPRGHLEVSLQCLRTSLLSCQAAFDYRFSLAPFPRLLGVLQETRQLLLAICLCLWPFFSGLFYRALDDWFSNSDYLVNSLQKLLLRSPRLGAPTSALECDTVTGSHLEVTSSRSIQWFDAGCGWWKAQATLTN